MKIASSQTRWLAQESTRKVLRRASSTAAVLAVLAAAIGVPVMSPQPDSGTNPVLAIARADCPPDCGGGPGNGGMPSGPPGGGTEFVPPSIPAMPSYDPGRGQPPLDQNNGISIYNSTAPQPSQAAQPSQAPVQNQDGSYNRAANGEQQPLQHNPEQNTQPSQNWQQLSDQLNNQPQGQSGQQPAQSNGQPGQTQSQNDQANNSNTDQNNDQNCSPMDINFDGHGGVTVPVGCGQTRKAACSPVDKNSLEYIEYMLDQARLNQAESIDKLWNTLEYGKNGGDSFSPDGADKVLSAMKKYYSIPDYSNLKNVSYHDPTGERPASRTPFTNPPTPYTDIWYDNPDSSSKILTGEIDIRPGALTHQFWVQDDLAGVDMYFDNDQLDFGSPEAMHNPPPNLDRPQSERNAYLWNLVTKLPYSSVAVPETTLEYVLDWAKDKAIDYALEHMLEATIEYEEEKGENLPKPVNSMDTLYDMYLALSDNAEKARQRSGDMFLRIMCKQ